ncbi:pseudouridine-metabolizing bifunctional protein C1861.05 [Eurytemora carolleeae]|uniref:pseudouridine-metabolizing bifunctional protein C1861.05 n=1 Tax=Eurytemora carolleeae TaxID=1294199 RepID=UPI000C7803B5|nr:pseudouridine-metabolizing bifunctional protein C1861.05 [Eurytemora carolleeae]|eukprot:XP_023342571.1 pseudouridine-metabolizing bifunctional protein C1861.05-like [Eurytemora affinis]
MYCNTMFYVSQIYFNLALYSHFRIPLNHVGSFKMALVLNKMAVGRIQTQFCRCLHNFNMTKEVELAIKNGDPVVALESTIITHGMPYPSNLSMARKTEDIIRGLGAVPATIAIIQGRIHVGLSPEELEYLATARTVLKTSRRDFPYILANKMDGGTTVSGTMLVANKAGIKVFVTGGIGGVHRGAETTMDISADLTELGRTPVLVVSAGVKSILDIGLTLEYLETMGVCVATLGEGLNFPAFYTSNSGFKAPYNLRSPGEAAALMKANLDLDLKSGILLGVPIPATEEGNCSIENSIKTAVQEAKEKNISGKEITPYILARLNELTSGESLRANIALVENNARVGAEVAVNLSNLINKTTGPGRSSASGGSIIISSEGGSSKTSSKGPVVVGGSIFDFVVRITEDRFQTNGSTHFGKLQYSHGGVGRNIADALARLGTRPRLLSALGEDDQGKHILDQNMHLDTSLVKILPSSSTATYTAILDSFGECKFGVGDMDIHDEITPEYILEHEDVIAGSPLVLSDGNIPIQSINILLELCGKHGVPYFYDPACSTKSTKPLQSKFTGSLTYSSPNLNELVNMIKTLPGVQDIPDVSTITDNTIKSLASLSVRLLEHYGISVILLTMSKDGVLLTRRGDPSDPLPSRSNPASQLTGFSSVHYPGVPATNVVSVSGAGDCLTAGFITAILRGEDQDTCVAAGMQVARLSCGVSPAIPQS